MAKGNMFLGMARGSVGDVTFYRNNGQQAARVRNRNPRNPKTEAQVIQRMILATGSKAYGRMKSIVDHSFENVEYGAKSQQYFLKKALETIRAFVVANYPDMTETQAAKVVGLYNPGNLFGNQIQGAGLLVSQGSLPTIEPVISSETADAGQLLGYGAFEAAGSTPTIAEVLAGLGAVPGDQITVCGFSQLNGAWLQSRYVINADATPTQLSANWDPTGASAAYDQTKTSVGTLKLTIVDSYFEATEPMWAWTVILSRKDGNKWLRSTQSLLYASDMGDYGTVEQVVEIWMDSASALDVANPHYLNQAESGE